MRVVYRTHHVTNKFLTKLEFNAQLQRIVKAYSTLNPSIQVYIIESRIKNRGLRLLLAPADV